MAAAAVSRSRFDLSLTTAKLIVAEVGEKHLPHDAAQVLGHRLVQDLLAERLQRVALSPHCLDVRRDPRMREQVRRHGGAIALFSRPSM